ncbi:MAG: phage protein GemA/Gp16 family protein, partial [Promethearchaeota archaeon]
MAKDILKRLHALAKSINIDHQQLHDMCIDAYKVKSMADMNDSQLFDLYNNLASQFGKKQAYNNQITYKNGMTKPQCDKILLLWQKYTKFPLYWEKALNGFLIKRYKVDDYKHLSKKDATKVIITV